MVIRTANRTSKLFIMKVVTCQCKFLHKCISTSVYSMYSNCSIRVIDYYEQ